MNFALPLNTRLSKLCRSHGVQTVIQTQERMYCNTVAYILSLRGLSKPNSSHESSPDRDDDPAIGSKVNHTVQQEPCRQRSSRKTKAQNPSGSKHSIFIMHFHDSKQGKRPQGSRCRQGPLKESGRKGMRILKAKGGACWRCRILKKQVSICKSIISHNTAQINSVMRVPHAKNAPQGQPKYGTLNASEVTSVTVWRGSFLVNTAYNKV